MVADAFGRVLNDGKAIERLVQDNRSLAEKVRDDNREYITIYYGADVKEKHAQKTADLFADICPDADVNLINGGQPVYYYLISAE